MKIIAFAGSNSSKSINHQLVTYAASLADNSEVIKLSDYEIPMYNIDTEEKEGMPEGVVLLDKKIAEADRLIISVAEHNGNITAFFKNILDWLSRNNRFFLEGKKIVVLSTSPGRGGAASALQTTVITLPFFKGEVSGTFSLASFNHTFIDGKIVDEEKDEELKGLILRLGNY